MRRRDRAAGRRRRLARFLRENWGLTVLVVAALLLAVWFALRTLAGIARLNDPPYGVVELQPWMTPRFVALIHDVPGPVVLEALGLEGGDRDRRLGRIARERGLTMDELTALVREATRARDDAAGDGATGDGARGDGATGDGATDGDADGTDRS